MLGDAGLGDTIRGMYAYFILSKSLGFNIYYDFQDNNLSHCFIPNILTKHICNKNCKHFTDFSKGAEKTHEFVNFITTISKYPEHHVFHIRTNHCFDVIPFKDFDKKENREGFLKWLKLTPKLKSRINSLVEDAVGYDNNKLNKFISVHIRCGDKYMQNGPCKNDTRFNPDDKKIDNFVENLAKKDKLILFTDNLDLRNRLKKYCLNTKTAVHIGKKASPDELIDTVAEFFILGKGSRIVAPVRSGFSYWPAVLFGKKITSS
jgi:hypothetical protein